jgi:hypothetical protein
MTTLGIRPSSGGNPDARKRVAIVQSCYIPWKGYFDMMARVDQFVLFDDVQFTKRDWRNRNVIKAPNGLQWLTIPVATKAKFEQRICDTEIADPTWARRHWSAIISAYAKAPGFREVAEPIEELYRRAAEEPSLSRVNHLFLVGLAGLLGIRTPMTWSMDHGGTGRKTERLVELCRAVGATDYLSGPSAKAYLDEAQFAAHGMEVSYMEYGQYTNYPQLHGAFEHAVSVIDLLAALGREAGRHLAAVRQSARSRTAARSRPMWQIITPTSSIGTEPRRPALTGGMLRPSASVSTNSAGSSPPIPQPMSRISAAAMAPSPGICARRGMSAVISVSICRPP